MKKFSYLCGMETYAKVAKSLEIAKFSYLCTDFFTFVPLLGRTG